MTIGDILGEYMANKRLTQQDVADVFGVSQSAVNRWIAGKDNPTDKHVSTIVELSGRPRSEVLEILHRQRVTGTTTVRRVAALETDVAQLRTDLDRLAEGLAEALRLLQERRP